MEEEEDITFKKVLERVITGHSPPQSVLDHPEFECRFKQFCRWMDPSGCREDLVRQVCLHILQSGRLKAADIQNEDQFFRWFFVVAANHLKARSRDCIEPSKDWPNTTVGLPFTELDPFFAHADVCPYHRRILLSEEAVEDEKFNFLVQAARGVDTSGVIRDVEHLNAATDDLKERLHVWNQAALTRGFLFEYIGLYNAEKKITTVSWFYDVRMHVSTHELNPRAGLHIRALSSKDPNYTVPLGRCDLIGVRHDNVERHFHLANGFTVGISIKQLTATRFTVGFRCVRSELITQPQAALDQHAIQAGLPDHIELAQPAQVHAMPAYIASSLLETSRRVITFGLVVLFLLLLSPVLQSLESREGVAPTPAVKSGVQAQPSNGGNPERPAERTSQTKARRRAKRSASHLNERSSGFVRAIKQELGKEITPAPQVSLTRRVKWIPTGTRVETVPIWQVRVYETRPRQALLVTHFVDNEKMRDQLEHWLPDPSFKSIVLTDVTHSDPPQTGYEIKWKTIYLHDQIVSVEATIDRPGKNKYASTSIFKEACAIAGCEGSLLSANAIANVYGYINPAWRSRIVFAMKSISQCLSGDVSPNPALPNGQPYTGVSGSTYDEIPNCSQSSASPPAE